MLVSTQQFLNKAVDLHNRVVDISKDCDNDFNTVIEPNVNSELKSFIPTADVLTIGKLADRIEDSLKKKLNIAIELSDDIEAQYAKWAEVSRTDHQSDIFNQKNTILTFKNELAALKEKLAKATRPAIIRSLSDSIIIKEKEIHDSEIELSNKEEDHTAAQEELTKTLEKAQTLLADLNKFRDEGKVFTLTDDIRKINITNYTFYSEEVEMKKDEVKFDITITANELLTCNRPNEEKFTVKLRTKGGVKLDFSTGLFFNFGSKKFLGQEFYYRPVDDKHTQIALVDAGKNIGLSLGALMHIYARSASDVKFGGVVGTSVSTGLDAMNFHVGPSLMFGDKERFCLSGGLTFREVKQLDKNYAAETSYEAVLLPENIPMVKIFPKVGWFISLTYNISRFNKE